MESKDKRHPSEPFKPENTPTPPQEQHPGRDPKSNKGDADTPKSQQEKSEKTINTGKRLGESPLEIDDETTI